MRGKGEEGKRRREEARRRRRGTWSEEEACSLLVLLLLMLPLMVLLAAVRLGPPAMVVEALAEDQNASHSGGCSAGKGTDGRSAGRMLNTPDASTSTVTCIAEADAGACQACRVVCRASQERKKRSTPIWEWPMH